MRRFLIITALTLTLVAGAIGETVWRHTCEENHNDPEYGPPIGNVAGYSVFGGFVAAGGYGVSQTVLDEIEDINYEYQAEYDTLQTEALLIYAWLDTTHDASDGEAWAAERKYRIETLANIDLEIDLLWCDYCDEVYDLVGATAYEAFLDEQDVLP